MKYLFFLLLPLGLSYASSVSLDENKLIEISKSSNIPELEKIQSELLKAQAENKKANDVLGTDFYAGYNYEQTKQKAIISFQPVFSPVHQYTAGIKKNFSYGFQADLSASVDNRSSTGGISDYNNLHTTTYALNLNIDLWKDLFGKITRKKLANIKSFEKQSKIQKDINTKVFTTTLRRIYWALIANDQKVQISQSLYNTALKQVKDAKRRKANSIADEAEVARYESQVASRQGQLLLLKYQREDLLKSLKNFLPDLANSQIKISKVNIDKTILEVLACTALIKSQKNTPLEFTQYDELSSILKEVQLNQETIDSSYDDIDLKLATQFNKVGVGSSQVGNTNNFRGNYQDSLDELEDGFSAGIMLTIPIGKKYSGSAEVIKKYNQKKMNANIKNIDTNLQTTHTQISRSVDYLSKVIRAQRSNSKSLKARLKNMQKKYDQARIPVYQLVQDQDALLSSDLSIVDTQLAILNTLLDYFVVFSETPCNFNKSL